MDDVVDAVVITVQRLCKIPPCICFLIICHLDRKMGFDAMFMILCFYVSVGGADGSTGEDPAGAGHHQAASVLHSAVSAREGPTPAQPSPGQTEAAPGDSGDEVSPTCTLHLLHRI